MIFAFFGPGKLFSPVPGLVHREAKTRQGGERLSESPPGWVSPVFCIIGDRTFGQRKIALCLQGFFTVANNLVRRCSGLAGLLDFGMIWARDVHRDLTRKIFQDSTIYYVEIDMDFGRKLWRSSLDGGRTAGA